MGIRWEAKILSPLLLLCSVTFLAANQPFHLLTVFEAGRTFDVLSSYGFMGTILHVTPIKFLIPWLSLGRAQVIFQDNPGSKISLDHGGDFLLDFCDSKQELLEAFFQNYTIEGLQSPYKAFAGGWNNSKLAEYMGIPEEYLNGTYNYILVRFIKKHTWGWMDTNDSLQLNDYAKDWVNLISPGDTDSVEQFLRKAGTHYVSTFTTGDIVYQVFVYEPNKFAKIRKMRNQQNVTHWTQEDVDLVFSPSSAEHIGLVMDVSQNDTVLEWLRRNMYYRTLTCQYDNLLKLYRNGHLKNQLLNLLPDESIVNLELKTVSSVIHNDESRHWVEEVLNKKLSMPDINTDLCEVNKGLTC